MRVLLVEDNVVNQRLAVRLLDKRGHQTTLAGDGRQALDALEHADFDAVLMDLQMPVMGGLEATVAIRQREAGTSRHVPIIAMTAHAMKGDRERCLEAGMDAYVSKPIRAEELQQALESFLPNVPSELAADSSTAPSDATATDSAAVTARTAEFAPLIDWPTALQHVAGDAGLLQELITVFVETLPQWQADLDRAVTQHDQPLAHRLAHTLAGSLRQFGSPAAALAHSLEQTTVQGDFAQARSTLSELQTALQRLVPELLTGGPDGDRTEPNTAPQVT